MFTKVFEEPPQATWLGVEPDGSIHTAGFNTPAMVAPAGGTPHVDASREGTLGTWGSSVLDGETWATPMGRWVGGGRVEGETHDVVALEPTD